jgi:hypothetical protein
MPKRIIRSRNRNLRKSNRNQRKSIKRRKLRTIKGGSKSQVNNAKAKLAAAQKELGNAETASGAAQQELRSAQALVIGKMRNDGDAGVLGEKVELEDEKTGWRQRQANRVLRKTPDRVALLKKHGINKDRIDGTGYYHPKTGKEGFKGLGMFATQSQRQKTAKLLRNIQKTKKKYMASHHKELPTKKQTVAHTAEMEKFQKSLTKIVELSEEEPNKKLFKDFLQVTQIMGETTKLIEALKKKDGEAAEKWLDDIKDQYKDMDAITIVTTANERIAKSMAALKLKVEKAQIAFENATDKEKAAAEKRLRKAREAERKLNELVTSHWYTRLLDTLRTNNVLTVIDRMGKIKDALLKNPHISGAQKEHIKTQMGTLITALGGAYTAPVDVSPGTAAAIGLVQEATDEAQRTRDGRGVGEGGNENNALLDVGNEVNNEIGYNANDEGGDNQGSGYSPAQEHLNRQQDQQQWGENAKRFNNGNPGVQAVLRRTEKLEHAEEDAEEEGEVKLYIPKKNERVYYADPADQEAKKATATVSAYHPEYKTSTIMVDGESILKEVPTNMLTPLTYSGGEGGGAPLDPNLESQSLYPKIETVAGSE